MKIKTLTVVRLTKLFIAGSKWVSKYADVLNDLNVYPVPDGDTGTNMSMTLQAIENDLVKLNHSPTMKELCDIVSESVLLGARGNSGTIMSQIIQGFLDVARNHEEIDIDVAIKAFEGAKEKAYKAVTTPVEGTMLTVIRMTSEAASAYTGPKDDFITFLKYINKAAADAVALTPSMLPKLKEAGVVDAGGKGVYYFLKGFEKSVTDPELLEDLERIVQSQAHRREKMQTAAHQEEKIENKYCTEFIIESGSFDLDEYKKTIGTLGDSMVVAQTTKKTKTHIHTDTPGLVLDHAGKLGNLNHIKIDNMEIQNRNTLVPSDKITGHVDYLLDNGNTSGAKAYLAVADSYELAELFINGGATCSMIGGQSHNPSVSDFEELIGKIYAEEIVILPNNKNIISTAKIAAERNKNKKITVLETKTMLSGHYVLKNKFEVPSKLVADLRRNLSIEVTQAVRNTKVDELEITEGDYIALVNGKIKHANKNLSDLIEDVYGVYLKEDTLNVFVVKGQGATKEANEVIKPSDEYRYLEYNGRQEHYHYYIYIEVKDPKQADYVIITDSTSDLTPELIGDLPIEIIPLKIKFTSDRYYKEGVEINHTEFWKRICTENVVPKTSQPSPAEFKQIYQRLLDKGYKKIISLHLSSKLSGTQQAAKVARGMIGREDDIKIIDSKNIWIGLGHMALEAASHVVKGESFEEVVDRIERLQNKIKVYFAVKNLKYLERGGRIGKASSVVGGILNLKPILKIDDGEVYSEKKTFGDMGAMRYMEKLIKAEAKKHKIVLYTGWGGTKEEQHNADTLKLNTEHIDQIEYRGRTVIGSVIGSHSGPIYGFAVFPKIY